MTLGEFEEYIKSIGFKFDGYYNYKEYEIFLYSRCYGFYNGSECIEYEYNDLKPIQEYFKQELRSIKLRNILG